MLSDWNAGTLSRAADQPCKREGAGLGSPTIPWESGAFYGSSWRLLFVQPGTLLSEAPRKSPEMTLPLCLTLAQGVWGWGTEAQ